jgi:hypothetical protein
MKEVKWDKLLYLLLHMAMSTDLGEMCLSITALVDQTLSVLAQQC